MPKRPTILNMFRGRSGLVLVMANGTAIPMQNRKDGNMRSANVKPFQAGCYNHQGPYIRSSTKSMPNIVNPRNISNEINLYFFYVVTGTVN
jgi:hypothetical protein